MPVGIHAVPRNFGIKIRMGNRAEDWLEQAKRDLLHAQGDLASGFYEWSCFSAQQAAEKVLKAVYQRLGAGGRGALGHGPLGPSPLGSHPACRAF